MSSINIGGVVKLVGGNDKLGIITNKRQGYILENCDIRDVTISQFSPSLKLTPSGFGVVDEVAAYENAVIRVQMEVLSYNASWVNNIDSSLFDNFDKTTPKKIFDSINKNKFKRALIF